MNPFMFLAEGAAGQANLNIAQQNEMNQRKDLLYAKMVPTMYQQAVVANRKSELAAREAGNAITSLKQAGLTDDQANWIYASSLDNGKYDATKSMALLKQFSTGDMKWNDALNQQTNAMMGQAQGGAVAPGGIPLPDSSQATNTPVTQGTTPQTQSTAMTAPTSSPFGKAVTGFEKEMGMVPGTFNKTIAAQGNTGFTPTFSPTFGGVTPNFKPTPKEDQAAVTVSNLLAHGQIPNPTPDAAAAVYKSLGGTGNPDFTSMVSSIHKAPLEPIEAERKARLIVGTPNPNNNGAPFTWEQAIALTTGVFKPPPPPSETERKVDLIVGTPNQNNNGEPYTRDQAIAAVLKLNKEANTSAAAAHELTLQNSLTRAVAGGNLSADDAIARYKADGGNTLSDDYFKNIQQDKHYIQTSGGTAVVQGDKLTMVTPPNNLSNTEVADYRKRFDEVKVAANRVGDALASVSANHAATGLPAYIGASLGYIPDLARALNRPGAADLFDKWFNTKDAAATRTQIAVASESADRWVHNFKSQMGSGGREQAIINKTIVPGLTPGASATATIAALNATHALMVEDAMNTLTKLQSANHELPTIMITKDGKIPMINGQFDNSAVALYANKLMAEYDLRKDVAIEIALLERKKQVELNSDVNNHAKP